MRGKRGQFYTIAALVIILIIVGLTRIANQIEVDNKPEKFYKLSEVLDFEGIKVMNSLIYTKNYIDPSLNVENNINNFLNIFAEYIAENSDRDISLIFIYGNITANNVTGAVYSTSSSGDIDVFIGGTNVGVGLERRSITQTWIQGDDNFKVQTHGTGNERKLNITIEGVSQDIPVLEDNNFLFVMTTSSGFNEYVTTNAKTE